MIEAFNEPFMIRALIAGLLVGVLAGYLGVFVVQRGLSFLGDGLAHAAFGGVALGLLLQHEPLTVAVPFTLLVAFGITWVRERTSLSSDTSIGIFFSLSAALGILFLSLKKDYSADAFSYLFGSILYVQPADIIITGLLTLITLSLYPLWSRWAYATFDKELAQADRVKVVFQDYLLNMLIAAVVVAAVKVVGVVLVAAFLVIPAATSRLVSRRFSSMTLTAMAIGALTVLFGLFLSYHLNIPSGSSVILLQSVLFFLAVLLSKAFHKSR